MFYRKGQWNADDTDNADWRGFLIMKPLRGFVDVFDIHYATIMESLRDKGTQF
ncbi:hypothetical protein FACS189437_06100 [Bacteroidia bacterium]|nr:hypothetical protein FACS189437_06100 [Bacteroidia bacterium]